MDLITHALAGRAVGRISGDTRAAAVVGALGALLPDTDSLVLIFPALEKVIERRGALHSCAGVLLEAGMVVLAFRLFRKGSGTGDTPRLLSLFLAALMGGITHLLLDIVTPWGVPLFWPLGREFSLGITRGFDPWITALVCVMTFFTLPRSSSRGTAGRFPAAGIRMRSRGLAVFSGCLVIAYLVLRLFLQAASLSELPSRGTKEASSYALSALNPFAWRAVVRTQESYAIYRVTVPGRATRMLSFPIEDSPCIRRSRSAPFASRYLETAKYPVALFFPGAEVSTVVWRDMRDQLFATYRSGEVRVHIDCAGGRILSEEKITWLDRLLAGTFSTPVNLDKEAERN